MKIQKIETGNFKIDGGAMFGVVPKVLWQKVYPADENNLCNISLRLFLVEEENQKILINTGLGNKQDEKFFSHYYLNGDDSLDKSLQKSGIKKEDITDVILTHLHFDHCGGAIEYDKNSNLQPAFPNATYWCSQNQWDCATNPNQREKSSFLKENILPLEKSGQLKLFTGNHYISPSLEVRLFDGHTLGQAIPFINYNEKTFVYVSDLIPMVSNIPLAWISAFDIQPLISLKEKEMFLDEACENNYILFFEHDLYHECCDLQRTEKGIRMKETFNLADVL